MTLLGATRHWARCSHLPVMQHELTASCPPSQVPHDVRSAFQAQEDQLISNWSKCQPADRDVFGHALFDAARAGLILSPAKEGCAGQGRFISISFYQFHLLGRACTVDLGC